jgi:replicative DNA helicase
MPDRPSFRHNLDAEDYILGAMITNQGIRKQALSEMTPKDFYSEQNRNIFIALTGLHQSSPTVSGWVNPRDLALDSVDARKVANLMAAEPSTIRWRDSMQEVRRLSQIRDLATNMAGLSKALMEEEDPEAIASRFMGTLEGLLSGSLAQGAEHISTKTPAFLEIAKEVREKKGLVGIPSRLPILDRHLRGFRQGHNVVVGARSGHGKTTLATTIVKNVALQGYRVLVQSTEMTHEQYIELLACAHANVSEQQWQDGEINDAKWRQIEKATEKLNDLAIYTDDYAGATPDMLRRNIVRVQPDLVVIDYLQRMKLPHTLRGRSEYEDVSTLSLEVDRLKGIYNVPLITVVQLSRKSEDRDDHRPRISDIRSSGQIEQDANTILLLHRPSKYDEDAPSDMSMLECVKNRRGAEDWTIKLYKPGGVPFLTDDKGRGVGYGAEY